MLGFLFLLPISSPWGIQIETPVLTGSAPVILDPILVADPDDSNVKLLIYGLNPDPDAHTIVAYAYDGTGSLRGFEGWSLGRSPQDEHRYEHRYVRRLTLDLPAATRVHLLLQEARLADGQVWRCSNDQTSLCPEPGKAVDEDSQDGTPSVEQQNCQIPCSPNSVLHRLGQLVPR